MWSWNYFLLVFLAVVGVLQMAVARNNFRGLLFFPPRALSFVFGVIAVAFSLFAFFFWNDFNNFIVEGSQQTGLFVLATVTAIVFTLIGSSLLNYRRLNCDKPCRDGLDALREVTFFQAIRLRNGKGNDR
jgi:hypothetical protein